jgi:AraC family transcriptional regulator
MMISNKEIHNDYKNRINGVFEFIDENLESDLS